MSWRVRSTSKSRGRGDDQELSQLVGPVVAKQPSDEQPEEEEPLIQSEAVATDQEREDEGASAVPGLDLEAIQQELAQLMMECERGDGPDVKGKNLPNLEPIKMSKSGEGQPQV
ncbi:putative G antigen family E member 3 [Dasypus novemcinctus]|uniref:putative G antigen family E member 3 n=1 Tax=Dasypus novemcinctus TaxID=9361 RepID=UPI000328F960|nr:putative G antigen family E member 3 [Dasypus novemcinctus]